MDNRTIAVPGKGERQHQNFWVYLHAESDNPQKLPQSDRRCYIIEDGVLSIYASNEVGTQLTITRYAPGVWHSVKEEAAPCSESVDG